MLHIKLKKCSSTQTYLKNLLSKNLHRGESSILVSTLEQSKGQGRGDNKWQHFASNIAMSCTLKSTTSPTFNPLKVGVLLVRFFKQKYGKEIFLKWPNDLMDENQNKVGGIICQLNNEQLITGIGINLKGQNKQEKDFDYSFIFNELELNESLHELCSDIYKFLNENNLSSSEISSLWEKMCCHHNKKVNIEDDGSKTTGIFKGINKDGAAIVEVDGTNEIVLTGSLRIF